MKFLIDSILYSYAQIFFSNRRWFGLTALAATFVSPVLGLFGLAGALISNLSAVALKYDRTKIRSGFYGFNSILVSISVAYFFEVTPFIILLAFIFILVTFFISSTLEHLFAEVLNLPGLSLPFVLTLFIFLIFITNYDSINYRGFTFQSYEIFSALPEFLISYFRAFGLILLQPDIISGMLLAAGILFYSRILFVNSLVSFSLNYIFLHLLFSSPTEEILILTSFNAIVASFALGGALIIVSKKTIPLLVIATLFIIIFTGAMLKFLDFFYLPVLVLPFNMVVLFTIYSLKFRQEQSDLVLLYFKPGSPEENFYYHSNRKSRFDKFKYLFPELPFFGEWKVSQGIDGEITHKDDWKYAWDFVITGDDENEYSGDGNHKEDYYCFNTPVVAPLDGEVVKIIDNVPDNKVGEANLNENWGNTIIIDHDKGLFSSLSHLKQDSIKVKKGDRVSKGEKIGLCGNSGRSPSPHLHFQFQLTDKLGDKTYEFPFSHYLVKRDDKYEVMSFDYPKEDDLVRNIETHKILKKAYKFQLGDKFEIEYQLNGKTAKENWEVKVDIHNNIFIENDKKSVAFLYPREKMFYISNFIGDKKSALYYFYLSSISVPLGYTDGLEWTDKFLTYLTTNNFIRYFSEFFLLAGEQIESNAKLSLSYKENSEREFIINSEITNCGNGIFSFYKEKANSQMLIDSNGSIKEFSFSSKKNTFRGINKSKEKQ
ncbi:MAG: urea transporter [Melioribacteraceae bacterium]|nr:urea transporter [Melioribacteraceae bacterium]MCF8395503.1 urea transporter [Melioribacteraceae bacterium]MCF8420843.1 urea transporter [Melioribacteraceae bacterium]